MEVARIFPVCALALALVAGCEVSVGDGSLFGDSGIDWGDEEDGGVNAAGGRGGASGRAGSSAGRGGGGGGAGHHAGAGGAGGAAGSDEAGRGGEAGSGAAVVGDITAAIARGFCGALTDCMGEVLLKASLEGNDCVEFTQRQQADRHLHWIDASIAAGRVLFSASALSQCEADLKALGCDATRKRWPRSCREALQGSEGLDQSCAIDQDCAGMTFCDLGSSPTCPGSCAALQTSGMPCQTSSQCADGLLCRGGVCAEPAKSGASCTTDLSAECPPGLICHTKAGELVCQPIADVFAGEEGASCDGVGKLCKPGLACASTSASTTAGKCVALASAGGACKAALPSQCPADQYCKDARAGVSTRVAPGVAGICSPRPGPGDSCADADCAPGARCLGDPKTCQKLEVAGGACSTNGACYGGKCDAAENVCAATVPMCTL